MPPSVPARRCGEVHGPLQLALLEDPLTLDPDRPGHLDDGAWGSDFRDAPEQEWHSVRLSVALDDGRDPPHELRLCCEQVELIRVHERRPSRPEHRRAGEIPRCLKR